MAVTIRHHSPLMSTLPALSAPQYISWPVVGATTLTPRATMATNTAQLMPTSRYVAGEVTHVERGRRTGCGGGAIVPVPGGRISGSGPEE